MFLGNLAWLFLILLCKDSASLTNITCGDALCVREHLEQSDDGAEENPSFDGGSYPMYRNRQPGKKMSWLTEDSIELKMSHGHGCFSSWTKLKLVLQPATIDGETQPCLFIGTVEGESDSSRVTVSGCKDDQANETIVTLFSPQQRLEHFNAEFAEAALSFTKGEDVAEEMFVLMWIDEDYVGHPLEIDSSVSRIDQMAVHDKAADQLDRTRQAEPSLESRLVEVEQRLSKLEEKSAHVVYNDNWWGDCYGTCTENLFINRYFTMVDIGRSKMDTQTGVWTAGLDGLYAVSWSMKLEREGPHEVFLKKNDCRISGTVFDMSHPPPTMTHGQRFQDNMNSRSLVLDLKEGDTLALEVTTKNGQIRNTIFSVHLL